MRLLRFEVQGYKNLTAPVVLDELDRVNVIHGDNNVGKSNVLEAIFVQMRSIMERGFPLVPIQENNKDELIFNAFNISSPIPIRFDSKFVLKKEFLSAKGLIVDNDILFENTSILSQKDRPEWKAKKIIIDNKDYFDSKNNEHINKIVYHSGIFKPQYIQHINIHRDVSNPATGRLLIPHDLQDNLFNIKDSLDLREAARWALFRESLKPFEDILGGGEVMVVWPRQQEHATLILHYPDRRVPVQLLGSGLQQIIGLLARITTSPASILLIEEPELNLRYDLQRRLQRSFEILVSDPRVEKQLIMTSHSAAFEYGESFYAMRPGPEGPIIARRPVKEAPAFTAQYSGEVPRLPFSYLTRDGLVQVPQDIRNHIGLPEGGGGVVFMEGAEGVAEVMSDATWGRREGTDGGA